MLTPLLFFILCSFAPSDALHPEAEAAAPDTTLIYFIDNVKYDASVFNGSQLVGQKLVAYTIDTVKAVSVVREGLSVHPGSERVIILHQIRTEEGQKQADGIKGHVVNLQKGDPLYIVDGEVASPEAINDIQTIESMTVLHSAKAVERYGQAAKYGAIIIQIKKSSK